jgi:hypothetical protein
MATITVNTSGIVDGQNIDAADVTTPIANLKTAVEDTLNGIQAFDRISLGAAEALTIAAGVISPIKTHVTVDTEAAASSDDLDTINNGLAGRVMWLRSVSATRVVTLRHAVGNIRTATGENYVLNTPNLYALLIHNGSNWIAALLPTNEWLNLGGSTSVTISAGSISRSRARHAVDTEGATASDDLDVINAGVAGDVVVLTAAASARVVRVRDGSSGIGNIRLSVPGGYRHLNGGSATAITLIFDGTNWVEHDPAPAQPALSSRNGWYERSAAATWASVGIAAGTNGGAGAVTAANDAEDTYVSQAITNVAGTFGGRRTTTFDLTRRSHNPIFEAVLKTGSDITNIRLWVGLVAATPTNVDTLVTSAFAFRYSTVASDLGWVAICNDGATQSAGALVAAIGANTRYVLRIRLLRDWAAAYFSVNEGPEVMVSSNLPALATELGACVLAITTTATAKAIAISRYGVNYG